MTQPCLTGHSTEPVAHWTGAGDGRRLVLENGHFRVELWPSKGGAITSYRDRATGLDIIWRNPMADPHRRVVLDQPMRNGSDLYDVMEGSWYVSVPNGFFDTDYYGAPVGTHGDMRCVPWEVESIESGTGAVAVTLVGRSVRTPLVYRRRLVVRANDPLMRWTETVKNRWTEALPVAWLQHPTFGGPLIVGARLVVPAKTVRVFAADDPTALQLQAGYVGEWPYVPERESGTMRDCSVIPPAGAGLDHSVQLSGFEQGWGCIWNEARGLGFAMEWEPKVFPHAWSWCTAGGAKQYPMWGEGHLITLQPSTSPVGRFADLVAQEDVPWIPAQGELSTTMVTGFVKAPQGPWSPQSI